MTSDPASRADSDHPLRLPHRAALALAVFAAGCLVFAPYVFSASIAPSLRNPLAACVALAFLMAAWAARRTPVAARYAPMLDACFVASAAWLADTVIHGWLPGLVGVPLETPAGVGLARLEGALVLVPVVLVLARAAGWDLGALRLRRGKARWWLPIGLAGFALFAASALSGAEVMFRGEALDAARVVPWIPWILLFVFANSLSEELVFRGLLQPRAVSLLGARLGIVTISAIFALAHMTVSYTPQMLGFLAITFGLSLVWSVLTHKTDSLWGAVLFHAGADVPVIVGIMSGF